MALKSEAQAISIPQHVSYICSRLIAYGLPLLYFLVCTSFYLKTYDSAQVKITFTQIGTTVLLFIWVLKMLIEGKFPFTKKDLLFVAPFLAYLISGMYSYFSSPFTGWAMEEALRRFFYIILALMTIAEIRSSERVSRLWKWLLAAAWVAIGYGFIQYLDTRFFFGVPNGLDRFIWRQAFNHRVFSTFGNPNFYGNFLVIITPFIIVSVLRNKGSLLRPVFALGATLGLVFAIDKMQMGFFGGFEPTLQVVLGALVVIFLGILLFIAFWGTGKSSNVGFFVLLFALLFLNLYATETKGSWLGFVAASSATIWFIFEFFLHTEETLIAAKKYLIIMGTLIAGFCLMLLLMAKAFILPLLQGGEHQAGFAILWIPVVIAAILSVLITLWMFRKPWNLKKIIYGLLTLFVLSMAGLVVQYAKQRLTSVSFRLFTWIATWDMIQTKPIFGTGVGSFKAAYPAFRRPQIIVLEGKSNTETDHSENEYLETWYDEGIVGFGIFLWMVLTALICGWTQLRWYSRIRPPPEKRHKRKFFAIEGSARSYEVLGILGAYVGALIHWTVDVSIRFVSSGIFSGLLPGMLVAYSRNHRNPVLHEPRLSYEKWIRVAVAGIWTAVIIGLKMELVPQALIRGGDTTTGQIVFFGLLSGALIYFIIELIEIGLAPEKKVPFENFYPPVKERGMLIRIALIFAMVVFLGKTLHAFSNYFRADVHHNLAIFFSKQGIWKKEPQFERKTVNLPPDIKEKFQKWGGALEHYEEVIKKNPGFPMARYFTGNVYNDKGSQIMNQSLQARQKGDMQEAERLREKGLLQWDKSEKAYAGTMALAPNYVQIHHQLGLIYLKRAQASVQWGDKELADRYYQQALKYFYKYKMLDPVFVQNYHRIVEIKLIYQKYDDAIELYREAIHNNTEIATQIIGYPYRRRVAELSVSLAKLYYTAATKRHQNPFNPVVPEILEAEKSFQQAVKSDSDNVEAFKGLSRILSLTGRKEEAEIVLRDGFKANPNDAELKKIFGQK